MINPRRSRIKEVLVLKDDNPQLSLAEIGREVGLSRERVRQIIKASGKVYKKVDKEICPLCQGQKKPRTKYCKTCYHKLRTIVLKCPQCGKEIERRKSSYTYRKEKQHQLDFYCSRECLGKTLGTTYTTREYRSLSPEDRSKLFLERYTSSETE